MVQENIFMAKRKYLTIILIWLLSNVNVFKVQASAYLPEIGQYKYSASVSCLDSKSQKKRDQNAASFVEIQDISAYPKNKIKHIINNAVEKNRGLTELEIDEIKFLKSTIKELYEEAKTTATFIDDFAYSFEIEYGISKNQSFGLKFNYKQDKFVEIRNKFAEKVKYRAHNITSFYKYKLFQNDEYIITLEPRITYSNYNKNLSYNGDLGLFIGHSSQEEKCTHFQEFGVALTKSWTNKNQKSLGCKISFVEGAKFKNNLMIIGYTEYQVKKSANFLYNNMIYEQISVAKDFSFANLGHGMVTAQIGYFWKGNVTNRRYTISGPIFSLWYNL